MTRLERVTVTLPPGIVEAIDRMGKNRSRFVLEAVERELERRRREALSQSLQNPQAPGPSLIEEDFDAWATEVADRSSSDLVDTKSGTPVRWDPGTGWVRERR